MVIMELKLTSKMPPSVNHYLGYRSFKGHVSVYVKTGAKKYKNEFANYVASEIQAQNWNIPVTKYQHFYVDMDFYFPRIDMDAPNYDKCLLDAITDSGLIWEDDNVVCSRVNHIYYDNKNPRIELTIKPVDYIGIFDNMNLYQQFVNKCNNCSRFDRGCSLLNRAIEGRIQDEIINFECSKYKTKKMDKRRIK